MHQSTLTLLTLLTTTSAFVPFPHNPILDSEPYQIQTINAPSAAAPSNLSPDLLLPSATPPTSVLSTFPSPSTEEDTPELRRRQGAAVTAAPAATVDPGQISPVTTYQVESYPPNGGAPVQIEVAYTQLFVDVPDQWPSPSAGSIGLGTIQGQVGVVKSKRGLEQPTASNNINVRDVQPTPTNNVNVRQVQATATNNVNVKRDSGAANVKVGSGIAMVFAAIAATSLF